MLLNSQHGERRTTRQNKQEEYLKRFVFCGLLVLSARSDLSITLLFAPILRESFFSLLLRTSFFFVTPSFSVVYLQPSPCQRQTNTKVAKTCSVRKIESRVDSLYRHSEMDPGRVHRPCSSLSLGSLPRRLLSRLQLLRAGSLPSHCKNFSRDESLIVFRHHRSSVANDPRNNLCSPPFYFRSQCSSILSAFFSFFFGTAAPLGDQSFIRMSFKIRGFV